MQFIFFVFIMSFAVAFPVENDLINIYEDTQETTDSSEHLWLYKNKILELVSLLIKNASEICHIDQPDYIRRVDRIIVNTLSEIYDTPEALTKVQFYDNIISPVTASLKKCILEPSSRISGEEFAKRIYPETLLHLDLRHRNDVSKWQDFRPCVRTQINPNLFPGTIPSAMDALWQSFLLGYQGCSKFWGTLKEWNFLDMVRQVIIKPLFRRWSARLNMQLNPTFNYTTTTGSISTELADGLSQNQENRGQKMSYEKISATLETCNVILFLRHAVDPIPCFRDVII